MTGKERQESCMIFLFLTGNKNFKGKQIVPFPGGRGNVSARGMSSPFNLPLCSLGALCFALCLRGQCKRMRIGEITSKMEENERRIIENYFNQGFQNDVILAFLKLHGVEMSLRTLKRRLHYYGLRRRGVMNVSQACQFAIIYQRHMA